jgi:hypothetical protein
MRKYMRASLAMAGAALLSLALLASAAQATTPAPPYEDFAGCPSHSENDTIAYCFKYQFNNGHLTLGKREIPVTNPIVFRGGVQQITGKFIANSEGGIIPVKQTVKGGLIGLTGIEWLDKVLSEKEQLKVYATVELAGQPGSLETLPLALPVKIHLENPVLGSSCYIGSEASPIHLNLGTGTTSPPAPNKPITGQESSEFESEAGRPEVLLSSGGVFVDNAFSAPGANGCQLNLGSVHIPIDTLVNEAVGLPSPAGMNTAILGFDFSIVSPSVIYP